MDVVPLCLEPSRQPRYGRIEAHNISRVPSPACPMLSPNRRRQRLAVDPPNRRSALAAGTALDALFPPLPSTNPGVSSGWNLAIRRLRRHNQVDPRRASGEGSAGHLSRSSLLRPRSWDEAKFVRKIDDLDGRLLFLTSALSSRRIFSRTWPSWRGVLSQVAANVPKVFPIWEARLGVAPRQSGSRYRRGQYATEQRSPR